MRFCYSLKYRWKECHTDIILFKKKNNYCSFACSQRSNSLVRAWARQNTQNGFRAQARFVSIYSVFPLRVRAAQESTAKTDQTVWMRRLISLRKALLCRFCFDPADIFFLLKEQFYGQANIITFISSRSSGELEND